MNVRGNPEKRKSGRKARYFGKRGETWEKIVVLGGRERKVEGEGLSIHSHPQNAMASTIALSRRKRR